MSLHDQLDYMINSMLPFVQDFHSRGELAPHAASISISGEMTGNALIAENDNQNITVSKAIEIFESDFRKSALKKEITATAIFFHAKKLELPNPIQPAESINDAHNLIGLLEHVNGDSAYLIIPYTFNKSGIEYEMGKLLQKEKSIFITLS